MMLLAPVPGCKGWTVSDTGRLFSVNNRWGNRVAPRELKAGVDKITGYRKTNFGTRVVLVHRAVLLAFVGPPGKGQECLHKNGDKLDNCLSNLRWGTRKENMKDSVRHGTWRNGNTKLSPTDVSEIRSALLKGTPQKELASRFSVSQPCVSMIGSRRRW